MGVLDPSCDNLRGVLDVLGGFELILDWEGDLTVGDSGTRLIGRTDRPGADDDVMDEVDGDRTLVPAIEADIGVDGCLLEFDEDLVTGVDGLLRCCGKELNITGLSLTADGSGSTTHVSFITLKLVLGDNVILPLAPLGDI